MVGRARFGYARPSQAGAADLTIACDPQTLKHVTNLRSRGEKNMSESPPRLPLFESFNQSESEGGSSAKKARVDSGNCMRSFLSVI